LPKETTGAFDWVPMHESDGLSLPHTTLVCTFYTVICLLYFMKSLTKISP